MFGVQTSLQRLKYKQCWVENVVANIGDIHKKIGKNTAEDPSKTVFRTNMLQR